MPRKINFINPFGTTSYDAIIAKTLGHYRADGTELDVTHLENCPADIDYFYSKHLTECSLYEAVMQSEEAGYDTVIVGCLYEPGVRVARELVDIPVIRPLDAASRWPPISATPTCC